jgi:hypothetical protein
MSYSTSLLLLPQTDHSLVNKTFMLGEKVPGAGFVLTGKSVHTVTWKLTNFKGLLKFQGTLVQDPTDADFFDTHIVDGRTNPLTETKYANVEGNYVWVRVAIYQFTSGIIQYVKVSY